jgi:DNA gyrase/topoisomerase IV subunit A
MDAIWLLLVYTVPAEPTRKRAHVWREVKKLGAVYVRDGVCILPETPETTDAVHALAARIDEFEGQATVVTAARLDPDTEESVIARFQSARSEEYAEITRAAEQLLQHIARETEHRDFSFNELEELEADLGKLKRWQAQIRARDYFPTGSDVSTGELLQRCDDALAEFLVQAAAQDRPT